MAKWFANCDFTIRGASEDEVLDKVAALNAAAKKLGIAHGHSDACEEYQEGHAPSHDSEGEG